MKNTATLKNLRKLPFQDLFAKLHFSNLSNKQKKIILELSLYFLNSESADIRDFGYRILLKYCQRERDFVPLFDVATQLGFIPIARLLSDQDFLPSNDRFIYEFSRSFFENFRYEKSYQTEDQKSLFEAFAESSNENVAVIAPTSYGKSQLIERLVKSKEIGNIAIIVPSKALIAQTRQRVMQASANKPSYQVIVHHDMKLKQGAQLIAVVTQERLARLYQRNPSLSFDTLFIDEAHNLFHEDKRARLLASSIIISRTRNNDISVKYLSPFIASSESLQLAARTENIKHLQITERLKSEDYYVCDTLSDGKVKLYDQFTDAFYETKIPPQKNVLNFLKSRQHRKSIVYINKPKSIEHFAETLSAIEGDISSPELDRIRKEISEFVHPEYKILGLLSRGVAYHHGSVPDAVRGYIENIFRESPQIKWIITNSTLLEGVNIPADALFVLDPRKGQNSLTPAHFRNLAGRVNRFSEIFNPEFGDPALLSPPVYLIKTNYSHALLNVDKYISKVTRIDRRLNDEIENPLLAGAGDDPDIKKMRDDDYTYIENVEPNSNLRENKRIAQTEVGKACFAHNVFEIDILKHERSIADEIDSMRSDEISINDGLDLMMLVGRILVARIPADTTDRELKALFRLKNIEAQRFYAMFFDWRMSQMNYKGMIASFMAYWKKKLASNDDPFAYVGKWGDVARDGFLQNYVDLRGMSDYQLINLAIVRIKEEQDFIDNRLVKFLEVFNDLSMVSDELYNKVKYGTTKADQIALIKHGLSHISANVLSTKYKKHLRLDADGDVTISNDIVDDFRQKQEREIIVFEVKWSGLIEQST